MRTFVVVLAVLVLALGCAAAPLAPPCTATAECEPGLTCVEGLCAPRPDGGADAGLDAGCASGGCECNTATECTTPAPCLESVCDLGSCRLRAYDSRCMSGEYCDRSLGCRPMPDAGTFDAPPPDAPIPDAPIVRRDTGLRPVGDRCILDTECAAVAGSRPRCIDALNELAPGLAAPPEGYCSAECTLFVPGGCGADAVCVETDPPRGTAWCFKTCTATADCRAGYVCGIPTFGGIGSVRVCLPPL